MSVFYLIDAHTSPLTSSEINDVIDSRTDLLSSGNPAAVVNGNFVIRIGDNQRLAADPTSLSDLLAQKYEGLKERYGFNNVLYDSLLDATGVSGVLNDYKLGERGIMSSTNSLQTTVQLATSTIGLAIVVVEFFQWRYINPKDGRLLRVYEELPSNSGSISLSVNNGTNYTGAVSGAPVSIVASEQGSQVILRLTSNAAYINIGSWAVLY